MSVAEDIKDKASDLSEMLELRLAAQQGYVRSQFTLAVKLAKGEGVTRDLDEAVKWYEKAAKKGFGPAQNNLGLILAGNNYSAPDSCEAVRLFRKAADSGYGPAQWNLARPLKSCEVIDKQFSESI